MAYGALRFLYNNFLNNDTIFTPSSIANGVSGGVRKIGTGTATLETGGQYTGSTDRIYLVQCDGAGTVGSASFRWRSSDTAVGTWEASGVSTSASFVSLEDGIEVKWSSGDTLVVGDKWTFPANAIFGIKNVYDLDRNREWRSANFDKISNGEFSANTEGWTASGCTLASIAGGQSGNCLEMTYVSGANQFAYQTINTVAGVSYTLKGYVKSGTSGDETFWLNVFGIGRVDGTTSGTWTQYTYDFVATGATEEIRLIKVSATAGTMLFDEIEVIEHSNIDIDLGSAQNVTAFILQDHNISDSAILKLMGHTSDIWTAPSYDSGALMVKNPLILYLDQTYRYWRILVDDTTNIDEYISIGEIFIGDYLQLTKINSTWGTPRTYGYSGFDNASQVGIIARKAFAKQKASTLTFPNSLLNTDYESLVTMQEALVDINNTGRVDPLFVHFFYDEDSETDLFLMYWQNILAFARTYFRYLLNSNTTIELLEVPRARV